MYPSKRIDIIDAWCYSDATAGGPARPLSPQAEVASLNELSKIFRQLDSLRDTLDSCLDGWEPPQLVVVGNENTGKSTLLGRLCMFPMFPQSEDICTRMRIEVRLRTGAAKAPRLEVFDLRKNRPVKKLSRPSIPMETANIDVRDVMDQLLKEQHRATVGVIADQKIVLHVQNPHVPTLDLVDLPGVVTAARADEPKNMPRQTQDLVTRHIQEHKHHSLFLAVADANQPPNASRAFELLVQNDVLDDTIGVITKADEAGSKQQKRRLRNRLSQTGDAIPLKRGYIATMNAPVEADVSNLEKLQLQAAQESRWFNSHMQDLVAAGQATTGALLKNIETMFLEYVPAAQRRP